MLILKMILLCLVGNKEESQLSITRDSRDAFLRLLHRTLVHVLCYTYSYTGTITSIT